METKICSKCKIEKPVTEYFKDTKRKIGIRCRCIACCKIDTMEWRENKRSHYNNYAASWRAKNPGRQHKTDIKRHYGLSIEAYNHMLVEQENKCAICDVFHMPEIKRGRLYVDHCHKTTKIRGLLCGACNSALGHFQDNIEILQKAIAYLSKD